MGLQAAVSALPLDPATGCRPPYRALRDSEHSGTLCLPPVRVQRPQGGAHR